MGGINAARIASEARTLDYGGVAGHDRHVDIMHATSQLFSDIFI
jgi:hypothetical protein